MTARFIARTPVQERSRNRVQLILQTAEALLGDVGLGGFSIPLLAERLDCPRATIYKFFPTPYALFNTLAEQHLAALEQALLARASVELQLRSGPDWRDATRAIVRAAADYYREHPVACILLLGGHATDDSFRAMAYTVDRLGRLTHQLLVHAGITLRTSAPDESALAIEFGTTCFRVSYLLHKDITHDYVEAGADAMIAFIERRAGLR